MNYKKVKDIFHHDEIIYWTDSKKRKVKRYLKKNVKNSPIKNENSDRGH